jgi:hypothetical protein
MIRARLSNGDFLMGIDAENVRRLVEEKDILVIDLVPMGGTGRVLITYGHTLDDVRRDLEEVMGKLPPAMPWPEDGGRLND